MLFKFSKRENSINFTKHSLSSFIFFHKKPVFIWILWTFWCISWMWSTGEVFTANNPKSNFVFATKELSEPINSIYVFNQGWVNNISNGAVFISQSCQFIFKCGLKFSSSLDELFFPVSAFAEDVGKNNTEKTTDKTKGKAKDDFIDLVHIAIGFILSQIALLIGVKVYLKCTE